MKIERRGLLAAFGGVVGLAATGKRDVGPQVGRHQQWPNIHVAPDLDPAKPVLARLRNDLRRAKTVSYAAVREEDVVSDTWDLSPAMVAYLAWDLVDGNSNFVFPGLQHERPGGRRIGDRRNFCGGDVRIDRDIPRNDVRLVRRFRMADDREASCVVLLQGVDWGLRG